MKRGQITIATIVSGLVIIGGFLGFSNYFISRDEALAAKVSAVEGDIKGINAKLEFVVTQLGGQYNPKTKQVEIIKKNKQSLRVTTTTNE